MYSFRIEWHLSTAFHPPSNKQIKRQNSVLEQYLWNYVNYLQDAWAPFFALVKFAYNASVHSSTRKAVFEIMYREVSGWDILTLDDIKKYNATRASSAESERLYEKIRAKRKKVNESKGFK